MSLKDDKNGELREQAIAWLLDRQSPRWSAQDQSRLDAWLSQDPSHRHIYEQERSRWESLEFVKGLETPLHSRARRYARRRRTAHRVRLAASAGVAVLAAMAVLGSLRLQPAQESFHTALGERRTVELSDGSRIDLNTDTELRVSESAERRQISLVRGEAYFTVRHDSAHPLTVEAGSGVIRDIGTRFDVRYDQSKVTVAVDEGEVAVQTVDTGQLRLTAGKQASYHPDGRIDRPLPGTADTAAWREGFLVINDQPLQALLNEMSRYHPVQWEITDPALRTRRLTGRFAVDALPQFLASLPVILPVTVQRVDETHVRISPAARKAQR